MPAQPLDSEIHAIDRGGLRGISSSGAAMPSARTQAPQPFVKRVKPQANAGRPADVCR